MSEIRIYTLEIDTCAECPIKVEKRAGMWSDWQVTCQRLKRVVTKASRERKIDPRCPLAKKEE